MKSDLTNRLVERTNYFYGKDLGMCFDEKVEDYFIREFKYLSVNTLQQNVIGMFAILLYKIEHDKEFFLDTDLFSKADGKKTDVLNIQLKVTNGCDNEIQKNINADNIVQLKDLSIREDELYDVGVYFSNRIKNSNSLNINVIIDEEKVRIKYIYSKSLISLEEVEKLNNQFKVLLNNLNDNSNESIKNIKIISPEEEELILKKFNDTDVYFKNRSMKEIFEETVKIKGDSDALVYDGISMSYNELNEKANEVANMLIEKGIGVEDFVVLDITRSFELLIGIYGVMKSGAAYVPVGDNYPLDRKRYIVEDCKPKAIIVNREDSDICQLADLGIEIINIADESLYKGRIENPEVHIKPENAFVTIYTSGTTGRPKGVVIENHTVCNYCLFAAKKLGITEDMRVVQFAPYTFSTSIYEIQTILLGKGILYLLKPEEFYNIALLKKVIDDNKIEGLLLPPDFCRILDLPDSVRVIETGGKETSKDIVNKVLKTSKYFNGYGLSEGAILTTWEADLEKGIPDEIPIGKPVDNVKVYIMNEDELCGINVEGEICFTGEGVTRGYLNNEELNKIKYVDNPFGEGKLVRTGDLGMWTKDGDILYRGRIDKQIQIRGLRIEPKGIESILDSFDEIGKSIVDIRKEGIEEYLTAYIIKKSDITKEEIVSRLEKLLPYYMIPVYFVDIPQVPMTINGKIDYKALSLIKIKEDNKDYREKNEIENKLEEIIKPIVERESVALEDDFFMIGGHSLRALKLINEIEKTFDVRLKIQDIFEQKTIEKLALLIENFDKNAVAEVTKAEEKEFYEMSSAQRGMYVINKTSDDKTSYNITTGVLLEEDCSTEKIKGIFEKIVDCNEILRTTFHMKDNSYVQKIHEDVEVKIISKKVESLNKESIEDLLSNMTKEFDLETLPLFRVLVAKDGDKTLIGLDIHHIIVDGMTISNLLNDFITLYNGGHIEKSELQFKDYSEWFRTLDLSKHKEYWKNEFKDNIPSLDLPLDYVRPNVKKYDGKKITLKVEDELKNNISKLVEATGTTEYMVFLSAIMILISKYSGQEDILIGSPVSGRIARETEDMMGMFTNTLVMRGKPEGDKKYLSFLEEIKDKCLNNFEYQEYPFGDLVEDLKVESNPSRNPLFDVMMTFQNNTYSEDSKLNLISTVNDKADFDLTFDIYPSNEGYDVNLVYAVSLFKEESAKGLLAHLKEILSSIAAGFNEDKLIRDLNSISSEEEKLVLEEFNRTDGEYEKGKTIDQLFEESVLKHGDKTAVVLEDKAVTYAELNSKANKIARALKDSGVSKGDFVAVLADKSIETIAEILAVLKSGAAYIPIDVSYPENRIKYILEDSKAKFALCRNAELLKGIDVEVIDSNNINENLSEDNLERTHLSSDIAYVIYTSGTTGKPKGVLVEHEGVSNLKAYFNKEIGITSEDISLQFASLSFDASISEMCMSILSGGTMCIIPEAIQKDKVRFEEYIKKNNVTAAVLPPAFAKIIDISSLDKLITAGSESSRELVEKVSVSTMYSNDYGPTEATVCSTHFEAKGDIKDFKSIPIGRPILNKKIYIMKDNSLCGIGIPGEICIAGVGIARGYLNKEELTNERFIENPYGEGKLYKSGDLGRWLPDGNIEYLGRIDEQVKVRGFRIETLEIENLLSSIKNVKDAAVVKVNRNSEEHLAAYIVSDENINAGEIKESLRKDLPEYMIPSFIVQVDEIELTSNGKVDKKKLQALELNIEDEYIAPETELENSLENLYKEVLALDKVSVTSNFFEIGGNSLTAMKLINLIEEKMNLRVEVKDIFEYQNIRALAKEIEAAKQEVFSKLPKAEEKDSYIMSSTQKRMFVIQEVQKDSTAYNMSGGLTFKGKVEKEKIEEILSKIVERHEVLRTTFHLEGEDYIQRIHEPFSFKIEEKTVENLSDEVIERSISEFITPFDLTELPLIKAEIISDSEDNHLLELDMHHIVSDGMSMKNLTDEFTKLYEGLELEPLEYQYKDYSEWMRNRDLSSHKEYWAKEFEGEIPVLDFPLDYARTQGNGYSGDTILSHIDAELVKEIKKLAKEANTTEYMVLLSAFMAVLSKYSRQEDICVGVPISGRTRRETESMLGMFANTIVMRGKPEGEKAFIDFLKEVRETCLNGYKYQEYPFDKLVEDLDIKRDSSSNPLFDVMFDMIDSNKNAVKMDDRKITEFEYASNDSKFLITMNVLKEDEDYGIQIEYAKELFEKASIKSLADHYVQFLKNILINNQAEDKIETISMVTEEEAENIKVLNATEGSYSKDKTIIKLFEEVVEKSAENTAVVYKDKKVTYKELNNIANIIAEKLLDNNVCKGDFVTLLMDKSIEMIASMLAVQKAGGVYVPVDTAYPENRINYILKDSNSKAVITNNDSFVNLHDNVIDTRELENVEAKEIKSDLCPEDLIYIIYTSGTTGEAKGVKVSNGSVVNYIENFHEVFKVTEDTNILQQATYSFDASVEEIYGPLLKGGTMVIMPKEMLLDLEESFKYINENEVDIISCSPLLLNEYNAAREDLTVRTFISGGDVLKKNNYDYLIKSADIYNTYGPTEGTVCASYYKVEGNEERSKVPIGKPIKNYELKILQKDVECGFGVPGELCILGTGVAKGYLNKDDITKEKFVYDEELNMNMYRTGDLARWLPDGNIEYLGRIDKQIKIRGYRIEIEEIDEDLRQIDEIMDSTVLVREINGNKEIFAYYVSEEDLSLSYIKSKLREKLPSYMIPSYFVKVEFIPKTVNGKININELPLEANNVEAYQGDVTEKEERFLNVVKNIVGINYVTLDDNFLEIGGDSIKALRLVSKLRENGMQVNVEDILQEETLKSLCSKISVSDEEVKHEQGMVTGEFALTPIQNTFFESNYSNANHYNQSLLIESKKELDVEIIRKAMDKLREHHDILRSKYVDNAGIIEDMNSGNLSIMEYDLKDIKDEDALREKIEETNDFVQQSLNIEEGSLVSLAVYHTNYNDYLLLVIHHLIIDAVSFNILVEDFKTAYNSMENNEDVMLPMKTSSYIEWSKALKEYGEDSILEEELEYWMEVDSFIRDGLIKDETSDKQAKHSRALVLDRELTDKLLYATAASGDVQVLEILVTALGKTIGELYEKDKVAIEMEEHGRKKINSSIDVNRTVGWFTNLYPMVIDAAKSERELLNNLRKEIHEPKHNTLDYLILKQKYSDEFTGDKPDILFNYFGIIDSEVNEGDDFTISDISSGNPIDSNNGMDNNLIYTAMIKNEELQINVDYNSYEFEDEEIEEMLDVNLEILTNILDNCLDDSEVNVDEDITDDVYEEILSLID